MRECCWKEKGLREKLSTSGSGEDGGGESEIEMQISCIQPTGALLSSFGPIAQTTFNVRTVASFVELDSTFDWFHDVHVWFGCGCGVLRMSV